MSKLAYPLEGIRVLDLTRVLAGPFVGRMLCDLGAEVIKVEPPDRDVTRLWGHKIGSLSGYYHQQNAGKKNVSIDLQQDDGRELLLDLALHADILVENFRPGVTTRLGIAYETLQQVNPGLVMLSISGFGQNGPEALRPAYAPIIHAESGAILRQAEQGASDPAELCMSFADTTSGLHGLVGVLAALHMRHQTGHGQHIDIAMLDAMLATDDHTHYHLDQAPVQNGASEVWPATGGPVILAGDFRHIFRRLHDVHGLKDPTPAGASLEEKISHRRKLIGDFLLSFPDRSGLIAALDKANLAWGDVKQSRDCLLNSPTLKHRQSIVEVDDRHGGTRPTIQSPYRFSHASSGVRGGAPFQGEHNDEVISHWLGYSAEELADLKEAQVLLQENTF